MKYSNLFAFCLFTMIITFYGCDEKSTAQKEAREALELANPPSQTNTTIPPPTNEPPQNAQGVWHYTCPKGCAGGAGAAGSCATCGGALAHNAAYHSNTNNTNPINANPITTNPITNTTQTITPPKPPTEPAQNAAGVWHYTCAKGCAGGAGSATNCSTCGGKLTHNAAYHN